MVEMVKRIESAADKLAIIISGTAFVGMVVFISMNVVSRYIFKYSFNWAEELTYLLFNWSVFFGVAVVYRYQGLTAIDVLVDRLPATLHKAAQIFNYSMVLLISSSLVVWGYQFSMKAWVRKSPSLRIPYFYYDISIPLASVLLAAYALKFLIMTVRNKRVALAALEQRS